MPPSRPGPSSVRFGPFELDHRTGELRRRKRVLHLQDTPLRLLTLLLERAGEIVTREDIHARLWGPDTFVEVDDSLNQAVKKLREVLGDSSDRPTYIETLPRRGYRFVAHLKPNLQGRIRAVHAGRHMVGRGCQLSELRRALGDASAGRGTIVCITGEPGIGKTTLVDEFLSVASRKGACHIAIGRCSERFSGTAAFLPVLEALQCLVEGNLGHTFSRLMIAQAPTWYVQTAPAKAAGLPQLADTKTASQERLKREFCAFLNEASRDRPVIFVLEDLHWADDPTVDLLAYIGSRCANMRMLLLGTFRPSDLLVARHPFQEVKFELQTKRVYREIVLPLLSRTDIGAYLSLEFGSNTFPAALADWLHAQTEGNPLFLVDLIHEFRQNGLIYNENGQVHAAESISRGAYAVPNSVRSMVERKLARLDADDRNLLQAASVQGAEFDSAILADVLGTASQQVEGRLETLDSIHQLVRFQSMATLPGGAVSARYRFVHALYQSALYTSLARPRLAALSLETARVLVEVFRERQAAIASDLAYLFEAALDWGQASRYFLLASEEAVRQSQQPKVAALARRAIVNAERCPNSQPQILRATFLLARAHQVMSEFQESIAAFELAEHTAHQIGDRESAVEAACGAGVCLFHLRWFPQVAERGRAALAAATAAGWEPGIAYAQTVQALERFFIGDLSSMRDFLDRASPVLEKAGPRLEHAAEIAVSYRGFLHSLQSEYETADPLFERSLERARSIAMPFDVIRILWMRGMELGNRGLFDQAVRSLEEALRMAELNGDAYWLPRLPNTLGWIYGEMGDQERSFRLNTEGVKIAQDKNFPEGEANARINLALEHIATGELDRADAHLRESELLLNQQSEKVWLRWRFNIRLRGAQATYRLACGETPEAAALARTSLRLAEAARARKHVALGHKLLGDIATREERAQDAILEYKRALKILKEYPCPIVEWRLLRALANSTAKTQDLYRAKAQAVLDALAANIRDTQKRRDFQSLGRNL